MNCARVSTRRILGNPVARDIQANIIINDTEGNIIANNGFGLSGARSSGIVVAGGANGVRILSNSIYNNGGLGIDLRVDFGNYSAASRQNDSFINSMASYERFCRSVTVPRKRRASTPTF